MSVALAFAKARSARRVSYAACSKGVDSWIVEGDASDLNEAQDHCTRALGPPSLAVQARAPYRRGRRAKTSRAQTRRYESTPQY